MGGNVSEWMRETYAEHWKIPFKNHIQSLQQDSTLPKLAIDIPMYYYETIPKSVDFIDESRLVYGANWLDERYSMISGKNRDGIFAKTFVASNQSFSTLGFRYVIEVKVRE
ncbi:MAG: hypothetical protein AB8G11_09330 [Saprospiraceae bacterium]